jgi:hypothetical protein
MDVVSALAKLLACRQLRQQFTRGAANVAERLCEDAADREVLLALDPTELNRQAALLLHKRVREVSRVVPATMAGRYDQFIAYAQGHWPSGHHRHLQDGYDFLTELSNNGHRVCLKEIKKLRRELIPDVPFLSLGWIHTVRGWRIGAAVYWPGPGFRIDRLITLG